MSAEACLAKRAAIERLRASAESTVRAARDFDPAGANPLLTVAAPLYALGAAISDCERHKVTTSSILDIVAPARELYGQSPFVRRLQEWPRGCPGDFEASEQLLAQRNLAPRQSFAWYVEEVVLATAFAQQHRNKINHQADLMLRTVCAPVRGPGATRDTARASATDAPVRILLVASGAAPDMRAIVPVVRGRNFHFVLNDVDADALALAAATLEAISLQCSFVHGNVLTSVSKLAAEGPYDLVLLGGLLDCLDDRQARFLIKHALGKLCRPGGLLYFATIARGNPYRSLIETIGNWKLLERDEKEVQALLEPFAAITGGIQTWRDPTRLTIFTHVRHRPAELM
jgi:extracellular factor (EF) 3-hydroxypalmitic acid methyl ester biosynthesis protein